MGNDPYRHFKSTLPLKLNEVRKKVFVVKIACHSKSPRWLCCQAWVIAVSI
jgi:hypothetical protein